MTKEDAIKELKIFSGTTRIRLSANFWEALNTVIKALEQEPSILDNAREDFMYDVYNTLDFLPTNEEANKIIDIFDRVTSGLEQESKPMEIFESTKDHILKLAGDYKCWDNRLTHDEALELCHMLEQEPSEDCISRQAVFETFGELLGVWGRKALMEMPPVKPTRKKGKWIRKPIRNAKGGCVSAEMICTCCGKDNNCDKKLNYCPNCGAEMEREPLLNYADQDTMQPAT